MKKNLFVVLAALACPVFLKAQRTYSANTHTWAVYNGDHKFSKKWGLHFDAHFRRHDVLADWQQIVVRPGLNYHLSDQVFATVGYAFVETWPYGEQAARSRFFENRTWQQLQFRNQSGRVEWSNRLRLEQRWVHAPALRTDGTYAAGDAVHTNRMRWMNRMSVPFRGQKIVDKSLFFTAWNEAFVSFGKNVKLNVFDQNRAFAGLGYRIPKVGRLEAGYLNQLIFKGDGIKVENNHTLLVMLNANFDLRHFER
jgi:hypothetical protein